MNYNVIKYLFSYYISKFETETGEMGLVGGEGGGGREWGWVVKLHTMTHTQGIKKKYKQKCCVGRIHVWGTCESITARCMLRIKVTLL